MAVVPAPHPAKYSKEILATFEAILDDILAGETREWYCLDMMGGIGGIHALRRDNLYTVANELEFDWACQHPSNVCGNALHLPFPSQRFDLEMVSVVYHNRMSDHHNAKDGSERNTYTHKIGHELHPDNAGKIQWNDQARRFNEEMLKESLRCLKHEAHAQFILNISDHIRKGQVVPVTAWFIETLENLGLKMVAHHRVGTRRNRQGRNGNLRVDHESVIQFRWKEL